jgi:uncharacterized coiled-coil protein SlyX
MDWVSDAWQSSLPKPSTKSVSINEGLIQEVSQNVTSLQTVVDEHEVSIDTLEGSVTDLRASMEVAKSELEDLIVAHKEQVGRVDEQIGSINSQLLARHYWRRTQTHDKLFSKLTHYARLS